jgi:Na+/melibiose symporter-like transporter
MEWRQPATADDFEHDVSVGNASAFMLLGLIIALAVTLVVSIPEDVVAPWNSKMLWLGLLIVLAILFFPTRWALRRPWTMVAETGDNGEGEPIERWTGSIRGVFTVRQQLNQVAKTIQIDSQPGIEGPLQPVA